MQWTYNLSLLFVTFRGLSPYLVSMKILTHFSPVLYFYTPWKPQRIIGFLTFSESIEMWHWTNRVNSDLLFITDLF